jgi:methyl-accepting chemotaxis protein
MEWLSAFGENVQKASDHLLSKKPPEPKGLFAFITPRIDPHEARLHLMRAFPGVPLIGCSATGTFTDEALCGAEVSLALVTGNDTAMRTGLTQEGDTDPVVGLEGIRYQLRRKGAPSIEPRAAVILADGFTKKGSDLALTASEIFGIPVAGGLAGDILTMPKTYVFTEDGLASTAFAMAIVYTEGPVGIGLEHGHKPVSPPLIITRASENTVYEISHKPAIQAWEKLGLPKGVHLEEQTRFLMRYELGLQVGTRYMVRFPTRINPDGSVSFLTDIPENTPCRILDAEKDRQIEAASSSARQALERLGGRPAGALVFDCAVRLLSLGDDFRKAVERIRDSLQAPFVGFESSGEIAMLPEDSEGFHNTTTVTLAFS